MPTSLNRHLVETWLARYGAAWEGKDAGQLTALFDAAAKYFETPYSEPFEGLAAIQAYWRQAVGGQDDIHFRAELWSVDGGIAIAHWRATFKRLPERANSTLDGVFHLRFTTIPTGIICTEFREWWHYMEAPAQ